MASSCEPPPGPSWAVREEGDLTLSGENGRSVTAATLGTGRTGLSNQRPCLTSDQELERVAASQMMVPHERRQTGRFLAADVEAVRARRRAASSPELDLNSLQRRAARGIPSSRGPATGVARRALVIGRPYGRCGRRVWRAFGGPASCAQRGATISEGHRLRDSARFGILLRRRGPSPQAAQPQLRRLPILPLAAEAVHRGGEDVVFPFIHDSAAGSVTVDVELVDEPEMVGMPPGRAGSRAAVSVSSTLPRAIVQCSVGSNWSS
jgi:hypothetical protein